MTKEELKKLAEIAGVSPIDEIDVLGRTALFAWVPNPFKSYTRCEWQPHLRIEQAMMVAEKWFGYEIRKNAETILGHAPYHCVFENYDELCGEAQGFTPAEAICRAALAAAKEV